MHLERGADDKQQAGAPRELEGPLDRSRREQLAEEDDVGLEDRAAVVARRRVRVLEPGDDHVSRI